MGSGLAGDAQSGVLVLVLKIDRAELGLPVSEHHVGGETKGSGESPACTPLCEILQQAQIIPTVRVSACGLC